MFLLTIFMFSLETIKVYPSPQSIFKIFVCFAIELQHFLIYFGNKSLLKYMTFKYFLSFCTFSFTLDYFFSCAKPSWCLMQFYLSIFAFVVSAYGVISIELLSRSISRRFFPLFSSRNLAVSYLTFSCVCMWVCSKKKKKESSFILLHVIIQFFQHNLLKRLFFAHCVCLVSLMIN